MAGFPNHLHLRSGDVLLRKLSFWDNGNPTPCGGSLENGDPLENNSNFGGFPYTLNGFTYNLQDLVTLPYFGAPASTSVNGEFTFHGESLNVCANGA